MKAIYKPYSEYKDSEVEWLGSIPNDWDVIQIKHLSSVKRGASPRPIDDAKYFDDNGEYAWTRIADVTASDIYLTKSPQRLSNLGSSLSVKLEPGALFLSIAGTVGKPCITGMKACIHDGFVYFPELKIPNKFLFYIFAGQQAYKGLGKFGTQLNLNTDTVGGIKVGVPTYSVISQIVQFLDHETAKIDTLIEKQQQLIALLMEKCQAVISHAVTKGLNPDVPMRDSGVEWLGEVPAHWSVTYLTHLVPNNRKIMYGIILPGPNVEIGVPIVKGGDVKPGRLNLESLCKTTFEIESNYERSRLLEGDLVYSIRGTIGDVEIVPGEIEGANLTQDAARISPDVGVDKRWLKYTLESIAIFSQLEIGSLGAAVKGINIRDLKKAIVPKPPEAEMVKIAIYLDDVLGKLSLLSKKCDNQISLLQERRTALISAAVTGKIDVRNWQPPTTPQNSPENQ